MEHETHKTERLQVRLAPDTRKLLERAAHYQHEPLSQFILKYAVEAAHTIVTQHERITLSNMNFDRFIEALENPREPNDALKTAFARYQKINKP